MKLLMTIIFVLAMGVISQSAQAQPNHRHSPRIHHIHTSKELMPVQEWNVDTMHPESSARPGSCSYPYGGC